MSGRCGILGLGKGRSIGLDRKMERDRIIASFEVLSVPEDIQAVIREALDSDKWDWFKDCDGCTGVSEIYWPTKFFPPCLRHDFDCVIGEGGWPASVRFYRLQRAYGMSRLRASIRSAAVTLAWYVWLRWRRARKPFSSPS
jgi:hypothetical protein